jgi:integrase/recombinase XerD
MQEGVLPGNGVIRRMSLGVLGENTMKRLNGDDQLSIQIRKFLSWLAISNYSERTVQDRLKRLSWFRDWCLERGIRTANDITKKTLEQYRRHLFYRRKKDGKPLKAVTQGHNLIAIRVFFSWLARNNQLLYNPASELELPKAELVLPHHVLSVAQVDQVMNQPDITTKKGIRDRSILETLYSSGIRRNELVNLAVNDINLDKGLLFVRKGKGGKDRVVPLGSRACTWLEKYIHEVRPYQLRDEHTTTLFLTMKGNPFHPDEVTRIVRDHFKDAGIEHGGACHVLRHSMATSMLENGADIRYIQSMLGHVNLESTQIYTKVSILKLKEVHSKTHPARLKKDLH